MLPYFLDNADPPLGIIGPRLAFEDDRHVLAEERKACRARARKLSVENNRRRKAQEERRQAVELREQKLREEILQERRRKLLEATEQHQRAHLPPSQRSRPVTGRPAHLLDNALRRIEGTFSWCGLQSPFYPESPSTFRRCHSSSNASAVSSKLHQQRQLSAAIAHIKLLQGKSNNDPQNRDLCFYTKLWEKQHPLVEGRWNSKQENPQDVRQPGQTETLSSLETENSHHSSSHSIAPSHFTGHSHMSSHSHTTCPSHKYGLSHTSGHAQTSIHSHTTCPSHIYSLSCTSGYVQTSSHSHTPGPSHAAAVRSASSSWLRPSLLLSSCQSHGPLERSHGARSASAMSGESVARARQEVVGLDFLPTESQRTEEPGAPGEPGYEGPPARAGPGGEEPLSQPDVTASAAPPVPSDQNTPTQSGTAAILGHQTPSSAANQLRGLSDTVPLAVTRGAWAGPDAPPTEHSGPTGGGTAAESVQRTGHGADRYSSHASVAPPIGEHSRGTGSGRPIATPAASLRTVNQSISTPEAPFMTDAEPRPTGRISTVDVNSDTALNKDEDGACPDSSDPSDQINASDRTEEGVPTGAPYRETFRRPSTDSASDPVSGASGVKSLKGIVKKQSKYAAGLSGPSRACGSFDFPKPAAPSVRHATARAKPDGRAPETAERRLRWSDEERVIVAAGGSGGGRRATGQTGGKGTPPQLQPNSAELQRGPLCAGRPSAGRVSSTGYHFAKRAWSDSGDRDSGGRDGAPQERRLGKSSPPRGGSRTPRAPRRAGSAPAGPRTGLSRRGAGVRPRSVAGRDEAGQRGARTQARMLSPHLPAPCRTNPKVT